MAIASRLAPTWVLGRSWGLRSKQIPCGSEPARDSGGSACIDVEWAAVIASRLASTWVLGRSWGLRATQIPCGSEPARDSGGSVGVDAESAYRGG
ncbi:hypothetical protein CRX69_02720 [Pseudomonas rhizophila]|uniref:Uncharacterized protein n=1 Tax=Pseudomonas rhizophila TaxID=2045200 RepID=A0ABN5JLZ3_9PSED|nr:hypothetical protein CRX69_02720 [Pseudomonas rhizophila]